MIIFRNLYVKKIPSCHILAPLLLSSRCNIRIRTTHLMGHNMENELATETDSCKCIITGIKESVTDNTFKKY